MLSVGLRGKVNLMLMVSGGPCIRFTWVNWFSVMTALIVNVAIGMVFLLRFIKHSLPTGCPILNASVHSGHIIKILKKNTG